MDDDELLVRARRDPEAFGVFYERHEQLVLGYLMRRTRTPDSRGGGVMTEFPALREALVAAAARRRRRRRLTGAAIPAFAVGAVVVTLISLPRSPPDREVVAPAPTGALEQAFAVFRRPQKASDVLPAAGSVVPGMVDPARTRLLGQGGPRRFFAVPTTIDGVPSLCLVAVRRKVASTANCGPVAAAVAEATPPRITIGNLSGVFLPDGSTDLRFIFDGGVGSVSPRNSLSLSTNPQGPASGTSWTGASGRRYVRYTGAAPAVATPRLGCPKRLEPLPADALAKAGRVALINVDRLFPKATGASVNAAARPMGTRCASAVTNRSIEVSLHLFPRSLGDRRVLLGMQNGFMRVYDLVQ